MKSEFLSLMAVGAHFQVYHRRMNRMFSKNVIATASSLFFYGRKSFGKMNTD